MKANRFIRQFAADERAVSEVIGAVLVFGILIAVLALVQTQAVPATNEEVEFQHSQKVQTDMAELNEAIAVTAAQGRSMSPTLNLGMTYPARLFFFNPSPVYGQLGTNKTGTITLENIVPSGNTNLLYHQGKSTYTYNTRPIEYRAGYHRFEDEPTIVREVGTHYERYPAGTRVQGGLFINGKQITLVTVNGTLERNSLSSASVETVPLSAPARTVAVTNVSKTKPLRITIPTQLSESKWRELLEPQFTPNGNIESISYAPGGTYNRLTVTLKKGVAYKLRMARIGVGTKLHEPPPAYLTTISGDNESVIDNGVLQVTVEVRDRLNNPVAGETVNLSIFGSNNGEFFPSGNTETTVTTAADGRASVTYVPPNVDGNRDVFIRASSDSDPTSVFNPSTNRNHTNITVKVADTGAPIGEPPILEQFKVMDKSGTDIRVERLNVTLTSGDAAYEIDWEVKDPDGTDPNSHLDTVELRLINTSGSGANRIVDSVKYDVKGNASDTTVLGESGGAHSEYIIKIVYADKGGYVREEACTDNEAKGDGIVCKK